MRPSRCWVRAAVAADAAAARVPPLYIAVSLLLNAWLSQRMFRYDALAEHASGTRSRRSFASARRGCLLGLALSPLSLVPLVNILVLPIYAGIAFTELCLSSLRVAGARRGGLPDERAAGQRRWFEDVRVGDRFDERRHRHGNAHRHGCRSSATSTRIT